MEHRAPDYMLDPPQSTDAPAREAWRAKRGMESDQHAIMRVCKLEDFGRGGLCPFTTGPALMPASFTISIMDGSKS